METSLAPLPRRTPFVGRERELLFLSECLEAAGQGESRVVLFGGEPGIGKSRLLGEFTDRARARGWLVLSGRAYDTQGMPPYLPFVEALRDYVRGAPDDSMADTLAAMPEIASLLPELRDRAAVATLRETLSPEGERYRLFEAVSDFILTLARVTESRGLLLCVDDLHWADTSTLLLFLHLARKFKGSGAPLLVLASYRTVDVNETHPLAGVLAGLLRERLAEQISLSALSPEETAELTRHLNGGIDADRRLIQDLFERTKGNPFFVEEVVRHLRSEGRELSEAEMARAGSWIPEGVRQVIGQRLARLSGETNSVLDAASVLGDGFRFEMVRAVTGLGEDVLLGLLDEAGRAGMVEDQGESFRFGHPMIQETLYGRLQSPYRRRLHLRAAEAIETVHSANLDPHLASIAAHYRLADTMADPEKTVQYAVLAADRAHAIYAYEEAIRLYETALARLDSGPVRPDQEPAIADLRAKLAIAHFSLGYTREGQDALRAALEYPWAKHPERRIELLADLSETAVALADFEEGLAAARQAFAAADAHGDEDLLVLAAGALGSAEGYTGNIETGLDHMREAYQKLPADANPRWAGWYAHLLYQHGDIAKAIAVGHEVLGAAVLPTHLVLVLPQLGLSLAASGQYDEAEERFVAASRIGKEYKLTQRLSRAISMSSGYHLDLHDFSRAEALSEEARDLGREVRFTPAIASTGIDLLFNFCERGDIGLAEKLIS